MPPGGGGAGASADMLVLSCQNCWHTRWREWDNTAMSRWYTSDHHFGHENIIKYCNRPFLHAAAMDLEMFSRWNDVVDDSDEV